MACCWTTNESPSCSVGPGVMGSFSPCSAVSATETKAPNGARFYSPGRSRLCRQSPGLRSRKIEKAQRAEFPGECWTNQQESAPLGLLLFIFSNPGLRFAAPWAVESRPIRGFPSGQRILIAFLLRDLRVLCVLYFLSSNSRCARNDKFAAP